MIIMLRNPIERWGGGGASPLRRCQGRGRMGGGGASHTNTHARTADIVMLLYVLQAFALIHAHTYTHTHRLYSSFWRYSHYNTKYGNTVQGFEAFVDEQVGSARGGGGSFAAAWASSRCSNAVVGLAGAQEAVGGGTPAGAGYAPHSAALSIRIPRSSIAST